MRKIFPILVIIVVIFLVWTSGCTNKTPIPNQTSTIQTPSPSVNLNLGSGTVSTTATQPGVTTSSQEIVVQPRGIADTAFVVDVMIPEKIAHGTTLVGDLHDLTRPRIVEVNMLGEIVWKYDVPEELRNYVNPGFSVVPLQNGNILAAFPRNGVYEINRSSRDVVWKFIDPQVSHDAERLGNGNTLVVDGGYGRDTMEDAQVREINPKGQVVWSWYAKDHGFNQAPYTTISDQGWTHTNAASRLQNGDTLISLRNFNLTVEVDRDGKVLRTMGEGIMVQQHDPEVEPNGDILFANPGRPPKAIEIDPTGKVVWDYTIPKDTGFSSPTRDADRLQNGNTLITAANRIIEVTPQGEIVWQFRMKDMQFASRNDAESRGFYKAIRIPA
jgi:outer membrane protein assembly factor BamB